VSRDVQVTVNAPQSRIDGSRCLIVTPGDTLIFVGIDVEDFKAAADVAAGLKEQLGVERVILTDSLDAIGVRDLSAELADAQDEMRRMGELFEAMRVEHGKAIDARDEAWRELERVRAGGSA
jgi:hypothetical protein